MSTVTKAVRDALATPDMRDAISDVKRLMCAELALADPAASIRSTAYFNHTYVPDVVMDWGSGRQREVYLRFVSTPQRLVADAETFGSTGPVIIDLSPASEQPAGTASTAQMARREVAHEAVARAPRLLITDSEATPHIRPGKSQNVVERLVAGNLLQHGRGHLDAPTATRAVAAARTGYAGAIATDPEKVELALAAAEQRFGPETEQRVKRTLQLLWMMGGGSSGEFPAGYLDHETIHPADTSDFLQEVFADDPTIEDDALWERLVGHLDFDTLVAAGEIAASENLNRLMRVLAGKLVLSHATLDSHERQLPLAGPLSWRLTDEFLDLQGPEWVCRFTPHGGRFSQRKAVGKPVVLSEAARRSSTYQVSAAQIDEAAREISLSRKPAQQAPLGRNTLRALAAGFGDSAAVRTLAVTLDNSLITADFERMMVGADPDVSVHSMALVVARILGALNDDEEAELVEFLGG